MSWSGSLPILPSPARQLVGAAICDFVREHGTEKHYVFIRLFPTPTPDDSKSAKSGDTCGGFRDVFGGRGWM